VLFKNNKQWARQINPKMKRTFSASLGAVFALRSGTGLFFPSVEVFDFFFPDLSSSTKLFGQSVGEEAFSGLFTSTGYNTIIYKKQLTRSTIIEVKYYL
jgi:hypothetical protein